MDPRTINFLTEVGLIVLPILIVAAIMCFIRKKSKGLGFDDESGDKNGG